MIREISAGGVVVREIDGAWHIALIEPQKEDSRPAKGGKQSRAVLCLPKGLVDAGESAEAAAVREVHEETGIAAEATAKLVDIKYVYVRSWGDGERVFKIVSFYLMKYVSGNIGEITDEMRIEVKRAVWAPLSEASKKMAYSGERKVVALAQEHLAAYGLAAKKPARLAKSAPPAHHKDV
ncbi:MAG TPA: NUDIX domain-containing protein [Terriglobales bacterium]|nr:NUDIX domain-containing protein [Terriglobales bacterium]